MFSKSNEGVRNFWLRTFGDEELPLGGRLYCTFFTNSSEHPLSLHELSLVGTPPETSFKELCAMSEEATRKLPAEGSPSPAADRPVPTAEGLQTGCLLFWVKKDDKAYYPAKCATCLPAMPRPSPLTAVVCFAGISVSHKV